MYLRFEILYHVLGGVKTLIETRQASSNHTWSCPGKHLGIRRIHDYPDVSGEDYLALGKHSFRPADRTQRRSTSERADPKPRSLSAPASNLSYFVSKF